MLLRTLALLVLIVSNPVALASDYANYHLSWAPPKSFANGEDLSIKLDLRHYNIYYGPTRTLVRNNRISVSPSLTKVSLKILDPKKIKNADIVYIGMTSVSSAGQESDLSEMTFFLP